MSFTYLVLMKDMKSNKSLSAAIPKNKSTKIIKYTYMYVRIKYPLSYEKVLVPVIFSKKTKASLSSNTEIYSFSIEMCGVKSICRCLITVYNNS